MEEPRALWPQVRDWRSDAAARGAGPVSPAEGGNFGLAVGERKFWVGDPVTVRDPILRMGLVFVFGLLEIV